MEPTLDTTTAQSTTPTDAQATNVVSGDPVIDMPSFEGGPMSEMPAEEGLSFDASGPMSTIDSAVVSSEPARDVVEQNQTFIAESTPTPVEEESTPLFEEEEGMTDDELQFVSEEEGPSEDEIEAQDIENQIKKDQEQIYDELDDLYKKSDDISREQINAIKGRYKQLANEAREISKRRQAGLRVMGFRTGRARFAPEIQSGIIATEQRALVTQLGKLALMEAEAISEAKAAQAAREFQIAAEKISFAKELRNEKRDKLKELEAKIEEQEELQEKIADQSRVMELIGKGTKDPVEIFNALGKKVEFEEIVAITDTYKEEEQRIQDAIAIAISSGAATPEEIAIMNNPKASNADRKAAAYGVVGRVSEEDRALDRRYKSAQIANQYSQIEARREELRLKAEAIKAAKKEAEEEGLETVKQDAEKAVGLLSLITQLKNHDKRKLGTGASAKLTFGFGGQLEDFNRTHNQVKDLMTLDNLGLMKGVLSETDIQILASAATKLNTGLPEDKYYAELEKIERTIDNSPEFKQALELGYITGEDYAIAMGFDNEEIAEMAEVGIVSFGMQDLSSTSASSYYGS